MGKVKGKREGAEKELERYRERKGKRKNSQRQFQMSVLRYHPPLFSFSFWDRISHWSGACQVGPDGCPVTPRTLFISTFPALRLQGLTTTSSFVFHRSQKNLILARQTPHPQLSSPSLFWGNLLLKKPTLSANRHRQVVSCQQWIQEAESPMLFKTVKGCRNPEPASRGLSIEEAWSGKRCTGVLLWSWWWKDYGSGCSHVEFPTRHDQL